MLVAQRAKLDLLGLCVCLDDDLAVKVGEELVDFGCSLQLSHLVQKCTLTFGESKVEVELDLLVLSRLDGVRHGVEGVAGPEVEHPEDDPTGGTVAVDVIGWDLDSHLHLDEVLEVYIEAGVLFRSSSVMMMVEVREEVCINLVFRSLLAWWSSLSSGFLFLSSSTLIWGQSWSLEVRRQLHGW